jgi:uncharacterized protein involved in copper resistance
MEGMEKDYIKQKQMDMPKDPAKEGMEMDHSKMEGMKRTCKKIVTADSAKKDNMEGEMKMEEWICFQNTTMIT